MEVLTEDGWLLTELLYADYLALCGESLIEVTDKYRRWKNSVEGKSLRVNVDKTKGMQLLFGKKNSVLKLDPYGVCGVWIGCNSIWCKKCNNWLHRRCSDVPGRVSLLLCWNVFVSTTYPGYNSSVEDKLGQG